MLLVLCNASVQLFTTFNAGEGSLEGDDEDVLVDQDGMV